MRLGNQRATNVLKYNRFTVMKLIIHLMKGIGTEVCKVPFRKKVLYAGAPLRLRSKWMRGGSPHRWTQQHNALNILWLWLRKRINSIINLNLRMVVTAKSYRGFLHFGWNLTVVSTNTLGTIKSPNEITVDVVSRSVLLDAELMSGLLKTTS